MLDVLGNDVVMWWTKLSHINLYFDEVLNVVLGDAFVGITLVDLIHGFSKDLLYIVI